MVLFQATHLNPKIYEDPLKYKYDRFLNDDGTLKTKFNMDGKPVKYHFQPFGSGLRLINLLLRYHYFMQLQGTFNNFTKCFF